MKFTRLTLVATILLALLVPVWAALPIMSQEPVVYSYLPTGDLSDGRMMVIASGAAYKTLSLEPIRVLILSDAPQLEFGIFDANTGGR